MRVIESLFLHQSTFILQPSNLFFPGQVNKIMKDLDLYIFSIK